MHGRYLRQTGTTYSQTYLASALSSNVDLARQLVMLFETRFDPGRDLDTETRKAKATELTDKIKIALNDVVSLDHDRILRSYLAVIAAMVRTNAYQPGRPTLAFKLLPRQIPELRNRGRPSRSSSTPFGSRVCICASVRSPEAGCAGRIGLRTSRRRCWAGQSPDGQEHGDRAGWRQRWLLRQALPDPGVDREAWLNEGKTCYSLFITSLLDVTDNLVAGEVVAPPDVIRYDPDDPYLVVAADKGTATFSDIANSIAVSSGFWLGDAFASGGSAGYDHKAMGITARGAWVGATALPGDGRRLPDRRRHLRWDW